MGKRQAVLGLVLEQPDYGYKLAQRLSERCPWDWAPSGVYGDLDKLAQDDHVRCLGTRGPDRAQRVFFEGTPDGKASYEAWMLAPVKLTLERQELDLKMLMAGPADFPHLITQALAQEQFCLSQLHTLQGIELGEPGKMSVLLDLSWPEEVALLQRNAQIKRLQVKIESLQEARAVMRRRLDKTGYRR